ncbi:hypothetical protein BKA61DRAFT_659085 [Leptodontidium sp. MPI-SDFR-AT-0119]|nr:hypothetical protein BKA61DRAFT_659085 [Leptodontidium sp. MPI-SDFR-AT-0119]
MPTYTIIVENQSGQSQQYLLFQAPPEKATPLGKVWSNVWVQTGGTPSPNGKQNIRITEDIFAIAGTTPKALADGVVVTESDFVGPVTLATGTTPGTAPTIGIVGGNPAFDPAPYGTTNKPNSFGIAIKPFNKTTYPYVIVGMGKYDATGNVVPCLTWSADPNVKYDITPDSTYYIATGSYTPGDVLDVTEYGAKVAIPFATAPAGWTVATITHQSDGTYSKVEWSKPPGQQAVSTKSTGYDV